MVNKAENTIDLLSIKTYINKKIENEYKFAESERKRAFLDPNW